MVEDSEPEDSKEDCSSSSEGEDDNESDDPGSESDDQGPESESDDEVGQEQPTAGNSDEGNAEDESSETAFGDGEGGRGEERPFGGTWRLGVEGSPSPGDEFEAEGEDLEVDPAADISTDSHGKPLVPLWHVT